MDLKLSATMRNTYLLALAAMCLCGLLCAAPAVADDDSAIKKDKDKITAVKINPDICAEFQIRASIMEINRMKSYLIVGEKTCHVKNFQIGEEIFSPRLVDSNDNSIGLKDFKEGDRVFVRGFELDNGKIFVSEVVRMNSKVKMP